MSLFADGFGSFLLSGDFYDVVLKTGNKKYRAHKILLCYNSQFFERLFSSEQTWKELETTVVSLKFPDPANVFPLVRSHTLALTNLLDSTVHLRGSVGLRRGLCGSFDGASGLLSHREAVRSSPPSPLASTALC